MQKYTNTLIIKIGNNVDFCPKAKPYIILVAAPERHELLSSCTGRYTDEVLYYVVHPINNPAHNPTAEHTKGI